MTAHMNRQGKLLVAHSCSHDDHDRCDDVLAALDNPIRCHCACHPICTRPACLGSVAVFRGRAS